MSALDPVDPLTQPGDRIRQIPNQPRLTVEQALHLPALCAVADLAPLWGVSVKRMHQLVKGCALDAFKVHPAIGPRCFSGFLLHEYLTGKPLVVPTFGRKRRA